MIEATYFSKKLGRPILPDLVALNAQPSTAAAGSVNGPHPVSVADRKRKPVTQ